MRFYAGFSLVLLPVLACSATAAEQVSTGTQFTGTTSTDDGGGAGSDGGSGDGGSRPSWRGHPIDDHDRDVGFDAVGYAIDFQLVDTYRPTYTMRLDATFRCASAGGCPPSLTLPYRASSSLVAATVGGQTVSHSATATEVTFLLPGSIAHDGLVTLSVEMAGSIPEHADSMPVSDENELAAADKFGIQRDSANDSIFTFAWPNRADSWLPAFVDPADGAMIALRATFPDRYVVLGNGPLQKKAVNDDGTISWEYESAIPMPSYDFAISASSMWSRISIPAAATGALPIDAYVLSTSGAAAYYASLRPALDFFENLLGPYRWGSLAFVEEEIAITGQEHASIPVVHPVLDEYGDTTTPVHELTHHWAGNLVRCATWLDLWLSEGFATYLTGRFIEDHEGAAAARTYWAKSKDRVSRTSDVTRPEAAMGASFASAPYRMWNTGVYHGGAMTLRLVERLIGRTAFDAMIKEWFTLNATRAKSTADFKQHLANHSVPSLARIAQWLGRADRGMIAVTRHRSSATDAGTLTIEVNITIPVPGPLDVEFRDAANHATRVTVDTGRLPQTLTVPTGTVGFAVDPDSYLPVTETIRACVGTTCHTCSPDPGVVCN